MFTIHSDRRFEMGADYSGYRGDRAFRGATRRRILWRNMLSFNAAWQHPEQFSPVLSTIGSYSSIQWHAGQIDGRNVYPNKVRKEPKGNIPVYLQDGSEDLENNHGSWPLQNIQLANLRLPQRRGCQRAIIHVACVAVARLRSPIRPHRATSRNRREAEAHVPRARL